ncbi:unnamed protein product, partial [Mesorhabditis spiculigera]
MARRIFDGRPAFGENAERQYPLETGDHSGMRFSKAVDGIPVLRRNQPDAERMTSSTRCTLPTIISLDIAFAKVGTTEDFSIRIIGAYLSTRNQEVDLEADRQAYFTRQIAFKDVTKAVSYKFAAIPHIDLRLPSDFFYPIMPNPASSASAKKKKGQTGTAAVAKNAKANPKAPAATSLQKKGGLPGKVPSGTRVVEQKKPSPSPAGQRALPKNKDVTHSNSAGLLAAEKSKRKEGKKKDAGPEDKQKKGPVMKKGSERDKKPKTSTSSSKGKKKKTLEEGGQKKAKGVELVKEKEPAMDPTQEDHTRVDPDLITAVDFEFEQSYKKMQESFPEDSRRLRDRKKRLRPQNTQTNSVTLEDLLGEKQKKKKREQDGENQKPKKMYASYVGASGAQIRTWSFTDSRPINGTALPEYGDPFQQLIIGCFRDECPMRAGVAPPCPTTATSISSSGQSITIQPSCQTPSSARSHGHTQRIHGHSDRGPYKQTVRELDVIDTEYAGEDAAKKVPIVEKPLGFEAISRQMRDLTLQIDSVAAEVTSLTKVFNGKPMTTMAVK